MTYHISNDHISATTPPTEMVDTPLDSPDEEVFMQIFSPRGNCLPEGINTKYVITFDLRILFFSNFAHIYYNTRPIQQKKNQAIWSHYR